MNSNRTLVILLVVTVIAVLAAAVVILEEQASVTTSVERTALYPDIGPQIDRVSEIGVKSADSEVTVRRDGDAWVVPAKHNYRADRALVREVLLAFTRMEAVEPKTSDPALYSWLGLRDVGVEGSKAVQLSLKHAGGQTIASLLIGDRGAARSVYGQNGGGARAYVRKAGDAQSWLALGVPEVSADPASWVDDGLLTLPRERIKRIVVSPASGKELKLYRNSPADDEFTIAGMPKDRKAKAAMGPDSVAAALAFLSFDDVQPVDAVDWEGAIRAVFTAFDGLELTIRIKDGWARFEAAYRLDVAEEGEGAAVLPESPADGEAEAERLNARYGAWAYKLPDYKVKDITPTLGDLTEPVK